PIREPSVPVRFNSRWVIGAYGMNKRSGLWERDADFLHAALKGVAPGDLVIHTRSYQIDKPLSRSAARLCRWRGSPIGQHRRYIGEIGVGINPLSEPRYQLFFGREMICKGAVRRELAIDFAIHA